jgi:hypothetical protein
MTSGPGRQGWVEKAEATGPVDHGRTTGERACALPSAHTVEMKSLPFYLKYNWENHETFNICVYLLSEC